MSLEYLITDVILGIASMIELPLDVGAFASTCHRLKFITRCKQLQLSLSLPTHKGDLINQLVYDYLMSNISLGYLRRVIKVYNLTSAYNRAIVKAIESTTDADGLYLNIVRLFYFYPNSYLDKQFIPGVIYELAFKRTDVALIQRYLDLFVSRDRSSTQGLIYINEARRVIKRWHWLSPDYKLLDTNSKTHFYHLMTSAYCKLVFDLDADKYYISRQFNRVSDADD
jgi:hypothetical protein